MGQRLVVSEFPNDNPELHDGLVWACPSPCAPALPTLRLRPSERRRVLRPQWEARTPVPAAVVVETETIVKAEATIETGAIVEPEATIETEAFAATIAEPERLVTTSVEPETRAGPAGASGFDAFVAALASILAERGATRAAANIGALLGKSRLSRDAFEPATKKALAARGYIDAKSGRPTPEFSVVAHAWREVLDGTSADLSACGSATLDVWGAELLSVLLLAPADELRRALRQRGVAAFGMLAAA